MSIIYSSGLATHFFHSFETSTNCNTNNTLLDRPLSHRTHRNEIHCRPEKKIFFFPQNKRGNEKKAEISLNIILASATDEKFKTFHWQAAVILKETDVQTDCFFFKQISNQLNSSLTTRNNTRLPVLSVQPLRSPCLHGVPKY